MELVVEQLRELDREMLLTLRELGREALGESALDEWLLPVIAGHGWLYIARDQGAIVGAAEVIRSRDGKAAYLEGFYIVPSSQGRGFGRRLLTEVMVRLRREGLEYLWATADPGNETAMRLYRGAGFSGSRRVLRDHYGPGRDRIMLKAGLAGDNE